MLVGRGGRRKKMKIKMSDRSDGERGNEYGRRRREYEVVNV